MAVIQKFYVEIGGTAHEFSRAEVEALLADLAEALGTVPPGLADDMDELINNVRAVRFMLEDATSGAATAAAEFSQGFVEGAADATRLTPDEYLASQQVQSQASTPPQHERHPGSGIGNAHAS